MKHVIHATTALGCVLLILCQKPQKQETVVVAKPPVSVEAIKAQTGIIQRELTLSGIATGFKEVTVISETQGIIRSENFELGNKVFSGSVLVTVDSTLQQASYEQAKTAHVSALLQLNVVKKLYDSKNASEAELNAAQLQETSAAAALKVAQKSLNDTKIIAPISGFIAQKEVTLSAGNYLSAGTPVTRIIDISSLKAKLLVGEMEIGQLKTGTAVEITVPAIEQSFKGNITAIAAGNDPSTGSYAVEVGWKNTPDLKIKSGMSVSVQLGTAAKDTAIFVPAFSIIEKEYKKAVFIASGNKAVLRFITIGKVLDSKVAIIDGIAPGDSILTSGMTTIGRGDSLIVTMLDERGGNK